MSTQSGYTQSGFARTLDGLQVLEADEVQIGGQTLQLGNLFDKTTDTTDDITEGVANLFLTPAERADIAANTAARHSPVTIGTANGLSVGGVSGQELSLGLAGLFAPGAISAATYLDIQVAKAAAHPRLTLLPGSENGLVLDGTNQILSQSVASSTVTGALSNADWITFNGKQDAITGAATTITMANLMASRALVSDGSGKVAASSVTSTELGYVAGVTSSIQAQINALGASPWQEIVTPGGSFIRTYTIPATVEVNDRLAVTGDATFTGRVGIGTNAVPSSYQFDVSGGGRFTGPLDTGFTTITQNGANSRLVGTDHCYLEFYPRGVGAGRKAYIGFPGAGSTTLSIINQDSNNIIEMTRTGINTSIIPTNYVMGINGNVTMGRYFDNFGSRYIGINELAIGTGGVFLAGMEVENTTLGGNYSQRLHFHTHYYANGYGRRMTIAENGIVYQQNGQNSLTEYGPNAFSGILRVGASGGGNSASATAAVISTNGNLHLDGGTDREMYFNWYSPGRTIYNNSDQWIAYNTALSRGFNAPMPIRHIFLNYNVISPVYYPGTTWTLLPGFNFTVDPLRASSRFHLRAVLSVAWYGGSSIAFRFTRNGAAIGVNNGGGVYQGTARTAPVANEPYWMVSPCVFEFLDHPNTTASVNYRVEMLTYNTSYGFRLNYPSIGGGGGDATAVISTMTIDEISYAEVY